jgi:hypothetical protein
MKTTSHTTEGPYTYEYEVMGSAFLIKTARGITIASCDEEGYAARITVALNLLHLEDCSAEERSDNA